MNEPRKAEAKAVEQLPVSLSSPTPSLQKDGNAVHKLSNNSADIDWEIETIARRHGKNDEGTKSDGSQGCH